ncbi:MAG: sigma-54-dependent Fis family transcriptional regulator [Desulfobacterales bacterium]|nr:sigma-54-dependent Fis family transcriptional regulator [Desulfobacterales bacterium]
MSNSPNPPNPIIIVDDEKSILLAIDTCLQMSGMNNIITCHDSRQVMDILSGQTIDVMLLDLNMPFVDGERLLDTITREYPDIPVIIVTGAVDVETAVRCIKSGAFDYIVKPVEEDRLITAVNRAISFQELKRENLALKQHILADTLEMPEAFKEIITNNKKMMLVFQYIESIARTSQPVLIRGETGVGKELIAKTLHELSGLKGNFVAVNAAGLDDNVFSDTLFGHVKGAFTGADQARSGLIELAASGTLFLDEIGDLNHASQVKLLRLLQEGEYLPLGLDEPRETDARIVAATNQNLSELQKAGKFRKDLNYRLRTHRIYIPPLCERMDDIPLLTDHFLEEASRSLNKKKPTPPKELFTLLKTYHFPGNIRELQSMIFDAVSRHKSGVLSLEVFKSLITREQASETVETEHKTDDSALIIFPGRLPSIKQATELLIAEAVKRAQGNQSIASKMLGISQQALSKRLKKK